jgi:hypothetical protein
MRAYSAGRPATVEVAMSIARKQLLAGLLAGALLWSPIAAPAFASPKTAADFTIETCRGAIDDPAKVDAMAQEQHWTSAPEGLAGAQNNLAKLRSAWTVNEGEDKFIIATGTSQNTGSDGTGNVCMVMFPDAKVQRNEFYNVISTAMELKPIGTMTLQQARIEMFEIKDEGRAKLILQLMSLNNGKVTMAGLVSVSLSGSKQPDTVQVDGSVRAFRGFDASLVYVLGTDGKLWREFDAWNNVLQPRQNVDNNVNAFQPLDAHIVFVLEADGTLWRDFGVWNNTRRPRNYIDGNVEAFQALDINIAYVLGTDGKLWREFGSWDNTQQPRQYVDGHVRAFQAIDSNTTYVLGDNSNLWREFGTWNNVLQPRIRVDGNVRAFQALDTNVVYVLGEDGNLWREFGTWSNTQRPRVQIDGDVKAFQALSEDIVYVLGTDGNLWREQGTAQTRTKVASNVLGFHAINDSTVYVLCPGGGLFRTQVAHSEPTSTQSN